MMPLDAYSGSLSPLPKGQRTSLELLGGIGVVSLLASSALFLHITWAYIVIIRRAWGKPKAAARPQAEEGRGVDLSLGLSQQHYEQYKRKHNASVSQSSVGWTWAPPPPAGKGGVERPRGSVNRQIASHNPHILLIYNIISADVGLSAAFSISIVWLYNDGIDINDARCKAQGWLIGFGSLNTSAFLLLLAVHTFLNLVRGWQPSIRSTVMQTVGIWLANIFLASLAPMFAHEEHVYARQQNWCFIAPPTMGWRQSIYFWCLFSLIIAVLLYIAIFISLMNPKRTPALTGRRQNDQPFSEPQQPTRRKGASLRLSGHHPSFLIYPVVYICCILPISIASLSSLEHNVSFMTFAAFMFGALGVCNAILWSATLLLSREEDMVSTGLDHFRFIRTPADRKFGNIVIVQGGVGAESRGTRDGKSRKKNRAWAWYGSERKQPVNDCELLL